MRTEADFESMGEKARFLEEVMPHQAAITLLEDVLKKAQATGSEAYSAFFRGEVARLRGDDMVAFQWLRRARQIKRDSRAIHMGWVRFLEGQEPELTFWEREPRIRLEAWRSLSARAAHRIGNQLFVSQGALRTLKKLQDPEAAEAVADLEASRETLHRIIREFQRFSKNEPPALAPTQVGPLVSDAVRRVGQMASQVQATGDIEDGLPQCALDARQFGEVLGELLENALHHTPPGGTIRVSAKPAQASNRPGVIVAIEDTGKGVAAGDKERIFEPFFSRRPGGTGLGLAIVKQIVENHHGTIRETGQEGSGARFEIELPAHVEEETAHENPGS